MMRGQLRSIRASRHAAQGVTVLELLIVMTILLMITAATIPMVRPALQNRRLREASRLVASYLSGARSRAIETGRPVGVVFQRFNALPIAYSLAHVEVPPPYSGDTLASKLTMTTWPVKDKMDQVIGALTQVSGFTTGDQLWTNTIHYGDSIRFDYKGPLLVLAAIPTEFKFDTVNNQWSIKAQEVIVSNQTIEIVPGPDLSLMGKAVPQPKPPQPPLDPPVGWFVFRGDGTPYMPPSGYLGGVAFQIHPRPLRSMSPSLQLPEGVCVDLYASGMTASGTFMQFSPFEAAPPVQVAEWPMTPPLKFDPMVIFGPNGGLEYVTIEPGTFARPSGAVFFLVGRRELMADVSKNNPPVDENLFDPGDPRIVPAPTNPREPTYAYLDNFWVSVSPQTGLVTVAEMARNPQMSGAMATVADARAIALFGQSAGAR